MSSKQIYSIIISGDFMTIDLLKLNYNDEIVIDDNIEIPKELYKDTDIVNLDKVKVSGNITLNLEDDYQVNLNIRSIMTIHDSVTYDLIPYEFTVNIEETLEKSVKTLDLIDFLWHYIVLEVPLRFTLNEGKYPKGENFQVISEEEISMKNNPFSNFKIEGEEWDYGCTF